MRALRTAVNDFFARHDTAWEALMGTLVIVWLVLGTLPPEPILIAVEDGITILFAAEFGVRFLAAWKHLDYFKDHWIDVVTLLPAARGFRLLRLLRLLRLIRSARGLSRQIGVGEYLAADPTVRALTAAWLVVIGIASLMFYIAEARENPSVDTLFDAVWWSFVTATTVGYGDVFPVTTAGRIAAIVMMVVGIATFSALAGTVASALQRRRHEPSTGPEGKREHPGASGAVDPGDRLRRLEQLRTDGLITTEEYDDKRAAVLASL